MNQTLAVRLLEKRGHTVIVTSTGKAALEAWEKQRFDLILMDVQMPEMDGLEATTAIRERENASGGQLLSESATGSGLTRASVEFLRARLPRAPRRRLRLPSWT